MKRPFKPRHTLPKGPEHVWKIMREMTEAGGFSISDVAGCTNGVKYKSVKWYIRWLFSAGYVSILESRDNGRNRTKNIYVCATASKVAPVPRRPSYTGQRGRINDQIWTAMRVLKQFSLEELAAAASTDDVSVKFGAVEHYVRNLRRVGLITDIQSYQRGSATGLGAGSRAGVYRLKPSSSTGPKPLKITKLGVFDPNRDVFFAFDLEDAA